MEDSRFLRGSWEPAGSRTLRYALRDARRAATTATLASLLPEPRPYCGSAVTGRCEKVPSVITHMHPGRLRDAMTAGDQDAEAQASLSGLRRDLLNDALAGRHRARCGCDARPRHGARSDSLRPKHVPGSATLSCRRASAPRLTGADGAYRGRIKLRPAAYGWIMFLVTAVLSSMVAGGKAAAGRRPARREMC